MILRVECYPDYCGEQEPKAFSFGARRLIATRRWFKVEADDHQTYVLRCDEATGEWDLAALTRSSGWRTARGANAPATAED